ncbi:6869_t:CDS:1, partial [Dentiscutata erythropus]
QYERPSVTSSFNIDNDINELVEKYCKFHKQLIYQIINRSLPTNILVTFGDDGLEEFDSFIAPTKNIEHGENSKDS